MLQMIFEDANYVHLPSSNTFRYGTKWKQILVPGDFILPVDKNNAPLGPPLQVVSVTCTYLNAARAYWADQNHAVLQADRIEDAEDYITAVLAKMYPLENWDNPKLLVTVVEFA